VAKDAHRSRSPGIKCRAENTFMKSTSSMKSRDLVKTTKGKKKKGKETEDGCWKGRWLMPLEPRAQRGVIATGKR